MLKPGLHLQAQYKKLKETALGAKRFQCSDNEPYVGPVRPSGIYLWMSSHLHLLKYWFVLAERVPSEHLGEFWDEESPFGIITLDLDNNLEFRDWDPAAETFTRIYGFDGNDGTMWGVCQYYANLGKHISMAPLVFEQDGEIYTGTIMRRP